MCLRIATPPSYARTYMTMFSVEAMHNGERVPHLAPGLLLLVNSCLVASILADCCCSVNLAYFHVLHFSQPRYRCRRRLTDLDGLECWRYRPLQCHHLLAASTCLTGRSKFDVQIFSVKIFAVCTIQKFPTIQYNVCSYCINRY